MNLPATATDFLDVFIGSYSLFLQTQGLSPPAKASAAAMPVIHVYAFSSHASDPIGDIVERIATTLRCEANLIR